MLIYIIIIIAVIITGTVVFINQPSFGRIPRGERLERIKHSPNYKDGQFQNQHPTPSLTSRDGRFATMLRFVLRKTSGSRPTVPITVIKTDLHKLDRTTDIMVWFGHSSYFIQTDHTRFLIDPVFSKAAPISFINKPFDGTDVFKPEDMPDIDYLIITHDHWDHLDYNTVSALKDRIKHVICPLGVGEHFEYWGFDKGRITELDWMEMSEADTELIIHCLPARHFSGRGLKPNRTLWASFLIESKSRKIYIGGDGGYDTHFAEIGAKFPDIDLAIMENGQYNEDWRYIHLMPQLMNKAINDLKPKKIITVHHSKYALARHRWDEPLENEKKLRADSLNIIVPIIGKVVDI